MAIREIERMKIPLGKARGYGTYRSQLVAPWTCKLPRGEFVAGAAKEKTRLRDEAGFQDGAWGKIATEL
jgi:hypothetical protein